MSVEGAAIIVAFASFVISLYALAFTAFSEKRIKTNSEIRQWIDNLDREFSYKIVIKSCDSFYLYAPTEWPTSSKEIRCHVNHIAMECQSLINAAWSSAKDLGLERVSLKSITISEEIRSEFYLSIAPCIQSLRVELEKEQRIADAIITLIKFPFNIWY